MLEALILGLTGSMHCIVMCGPLHIAATSGKAQLFNRILFNLGRVITYVMLGLVIAQFGRFIPLFEAQQGISIATGVVIWMVYFIPKLLGTEITIKPINDFVVRSMGSLMKQEKVRSSSFLKYTGMGLLNGLLPCGLVYAALIAAFSQNNTMDTVLFMAIFGAATIPVLLLVSYMGTSIKDLLSKYPYTRYLTGIAVFLVGLLFILRGLNLGIPFISPKDLELMQLGTDTICH